MFRRDWIAMAFIGSFVTVGCGSSGPELADVSGTVKFDGAPLPRARITFVPEAGRPSYAVSDDDGFYELVYTDDKAGALPGQHTIRVSTHRRADPLSGTKAQAERIPTKYNTKSQLKKTVEAGANTIDLEISSNDGKVVQPRDT